MKFKRSIICVLPLLLIAVNASLATSKSTQRMKPIPGGTFLMGSNQSKVNQRPVHSVTISSFLMDSTEVTQQEFIKIMSNRPFAFAQSGLSDENGKGDNYPIYNVCWYDMVLYCNSISKIEGYDTVYTYDSLTGTFGTDGRLHGVKINYLKRGYRLPTEAEWEYACRAGTSTDYFWGNEPAINFAWFMDNSDRKTQPVGLKTPNSWGLYDMSGNVYDFCNDWYAPYDSVMQTNPHGPDTGSLRTARGGNMIYDSVRMRSSERMSVEPHVRYLYYGFRCVFPDTTVPSGTYQNHPHRFTSEQCGTPKLFVASSDNAQLILSKNTKSVIAYSLTGQKIFSVNNNKTDLVSALKQVGRGTFILYEKQ